MSRTPAVPEVPGWYINLQAAVLKQLPRPGEIDQEIAQGWSNNQASLRKNLADCLLPPMPTYEPKPVQKWTESDGVIYFSVTSDGTTGEKWVTRLEDNGFRVGDCAKRQLRSPNFKPTRGVTTEVAVLKRMLFQDSQLDTKTIRDFASTRNLSAPNAEVACLIREKYLDDEMNSMLLKRITVMHEPIMDYDGDPSLLAVGHEEISHLLGAHIDTPGFLWGCRAIGFAFAVSQSS